MKISIISENNTTISLNKKQALTQLEPKPFLHLLFEKKELFVCYCSISKRFFLMDKEAFDSVGKPLLAANRTLPFKKTGKKFNFFAPVITSNCNMACTYCFGCEKNRTGKKASFPAIKSAVDFLKKENNELVVNFFSPGEQLNDFELFEKTLFEIEKKLNIRSMMLSSNGTANPKKYIKIADKFENFQVSFDGPPEIQDIQRPLKNKNKSSKAVEKTIKALAEKNKKFQVKTTVTEEHLGKEKKTAKYFKELGVKNLYLSISTPLGDGTLFDKKTHSKIVKSELELKELCELYGINAKLSVEMLLGMKETPYCAIGNTFNLGTDGKVAPCSIYSDEKDLELNPGLKQIMFGELDKKTGKFKLEEKKLEELRSVHKKAKCTDCDFKLCWGGCPVRNLQETGDISKASKKYCEERKNETRSLMKYLAEKKAIKIKPFLKEKNSKLIYSMQFSEFELSENTGNTLINFNPAEKQDALLEKIAALNKKSKKEPVLFLLSPQCTELTAKETIEFKLLLYALREKNILFKITKPVKITDASPQKEEKFREEFGIPKNCMDCLELFKLKKGVVWFCNREKGKKLESYFDRKEIFEDFRKNASKNQDCKNKAMPEQPEYSK